MPLQIGSAFAITRAKYYSSLLFWGVSVCPEEYLTVSQPTSSSKVNFDSEAPKPLIFSITVSYSSEMAAIKIESYQLVLSAYQ